VRIISIINQKGGCGKTTSAINLAGITAKKGYRTLLVDMDPQSHCAAGLAIPEQRIDLDIGDAMLAGPDEPLDTKRLLWRASRNLDLAPSRMKLAGLEASRGGLADKPDKERRLASVLSRLARNYDVCFIDCSPSIGLLTFNALAAATDILIPVETSFFALQGATKQVNTIRTLAKRLGTQAPYWLVATIHDDTSVLARDLLEELRRRFGKRVSPEVIRRDLTLKEAASFGQPIIEYSPTSIGAKDYGALAEWLGASIGLGTNLRPPAPEPAVAGAGEVFEESPGLDHMPSVEVVGGVESKLGLGRKTPGLALDANDAIADSGLSKGHPLGSTPESASGPNASEPMAVTLSRVEEMAQRARVMLLKRADDHLKRVVGETSRAGTATQERDSQGELLAEPKSIIMREGTARSRADAIRQLYGVRATRSGILFIQPLSAGILVAIAGDFNGWTVTPMKRNEQMGVFELCLPLTPGRKRYRLIVDGRWSTDPYNDLSEPNPFGELNSIIDVASPAHQTV